MDPWGHYFVYFMDPKGNLISGGVDLDYFVTDTDNEFRVSKFYQIYYLYASYDIIKIILTVSK